MIEQTPSVGRIVHYQSRGSADGHFRPEPRAAIITEVQTSTEPGTDYLGQRVEADTHWSEYSNAYVTDDRVPEYVVSVSLCVLNPTGMFFDEHVDHSTSPAPGCWSWPPRTQPVKNPATPD